MEKDIIRIYKNEEIEVMNYMLGKPKNNMMFTIDELKRMNKINLNNKKYLR